MIIYILLITYFLILLLCTIILDTRRYDKLFIWLSMLLLFILAGFRNVEIGNDTVVYVDLFERIATTNDYSIYFTTRYELGYVFYNFLLGLISSNPLFFLVVTSAILMYSYARFILRYSSNVLISVLLFFLCGFWSQSMNIIRMQLALVIVLLSYDAIVKKNLRKFLLFVMCAFLFHKTAIVFVIAYPLYHLKLKFKHYVYAGIAIIITYMYLNPILGFIVEKLNFYSDYANSVYRDGEVRFAIIISIIITIAFLVLFIVIRKIKRQSLMKNESVLAVDEIDVGIKFLSVTLGFNFLSIQFNLLNRCSDYFFVFIICFLPNIIETLRGKKLKKIIYAVIIICFIAYFFVIQIYRPEWNRIYPYKFYWN